MYYSSNPYKLTDYYPFGSPMPGRTFASSEGYKYGYQGSESENEAHSFSAETLKPYISRSNWYERKYNHHVNIVNQKYMYDHPAFTNPFQ